MEPIVPPGQLDVRMWAAAIDPAGGFWMIANGRAISRKAYAWFFALVGTTFGAGDGLTTFNIPNIERRTIGGKVIILVRPPAGEAAVTA